MEREARYCTTEGDLFGAMVIVASRIGGGRGKGFLFSDRGDFVAKGFEEPVRVYEVRWGG